MTDSRTVQASDGLRLHYAVDDFTDPWRRADTVLLLHAAMGTLERFRAWVPILARDFRVVYVVYEGLPHNITNGAPERCATELRRFLLAR